MNKLLALADRVEKLIGPDREVDCLIWCHTKGIEPKWVGRLLDAGEEGIIGWIDPGKTQRNFSTNRQQSGPGSIPPYTASLDVAMILAPDGEATQCLDDAMVSLGVAGWQGRWRDALPRFLAASALRARAHGGGE